MAPENHCPGSYVIYGPPMLRRVVARTILQTLVTAVFPTVAAVSWAAAVGAGHSTNSTAVATDAAESAIKKFAAAPGFKVRLFAAEPQLENPVAISVDERGRVFVAETHRYKNAIFDVTVKTNWLLQDLSFRTVGDRDAFLTETFATNLSILTQESEQIRLVEDRDGDGRADHSSVFVKGFSERVSGVAAGVLAREGQVWFTCIPDFWRFQESSKPSDKPSETIRKKLASGFGVHTGVSGHDLHGLTQGPDGRIYFSSGDRGFVVTNLEGKVLSLPDEGGVLRCEPDGTKLEIFARGLRNPQELAFNQYGDLFTDDNDTAGPDDSRVINVVERGDYGWRASYQFAPGFGPWITENVWRGGIDGTLPYAGLAAQGPSGLAFNPGAGLGEKWRDHFFVCDFPGGVWAFAVERRGASYQVAKREKFLWNLWPTDIDFMPDGSLLVADWVGGWGQPQKGRLNTVHPGESATNDTPAVLSTIGQKPVRELVDLLGHEDYRVRLAAQFKVERGSKRDGIAIFENTTSDQMLLEVAAAATNRLARIHSIWALGNIARRGFYQQATGLIALGLRHDSDPEIRAQYARTLGDSCALEPAWREAAELARDPEPRVKMLALLSLARLGRALGKPPFDPTDLLVSLARENNDADPFLTHAIVDAVVPHAATPGLLAKLEGDANPVVRRIALLAHRRMGQPEIARFLTDPEPRLVTEAARAINDVPIAGAMTALAKLLGAANCPNNAVTRAINANFRLGGTDRARSIAVYATRTNAPPALRVEALNALSDWNKPSPLDRVMGLWRPIAP